ncbi:Rieske 2Fe-2S domain-containing protein [uncultured Halopseudomonas sp.]|uniref:Rieske (2Fe-2S) protein n=1 Tax=uncultured Halopseudomonas sp. TaxID=2901193 RepID=UPI0030ECC6B4|tara:strand:+ start:19860 stop:20198 length:339 start_codon:yes stop_codon:yes gene_type:complete
MTNTENFLPTPLCRLDQLADPGSLGVEHNGEMLMVIRQGDRAFVYLNRCPHRAIPLEWVPNQFLDSSGRLIQCASHGALFLPESGECVAGPCTGAYLQPRRCHISNGQIWLD